MDMKNKKIIPYFQPIIALDTGEIYAFEALGRYVDDDGTVKSLGAFFSDETVPASDALAVDRIVRNRALEMFSQEGGNQYLFINLRLNWIAEFSKEPEKFPTVVWAKKYGIDFKKLVIEITEHEFYMNDDMINEVSAFYKQLGCRIAVDDFGQRASNIDRLAAVAPDILKVDMDYIHKCEQSYHYREYLKSLTAYAERIGIEVLYEGIETQKQLDICIDARGRFYQGFLLAKPQPSMKDAVTESGLFAAAREESVTARHSFYDKVYARRTRWDKLIEEFLSKKEYDIIGAIDGDISGVLSKLFADIPKPIKRIFVCNRNGEQLSHNIETEDGEIVCRDYRNRNWSWRNYFQEALVAFHLGAKSRLTTPYRDATTKELVYTYVYAVSEDLYLFIDIYKTDE